MIKNFTPKNKFNNNKNKDKTRINHNIRSSEVRLVGDNVKPDIYTIQEALSIADDLNLDLVEISNIGDLPICKIIDFKKYLYDKKKKEDEQKKKQKSSQIKTKEIRLGANIDEHDFDFKQKHAINFLKEGDSVLVVLFFKGREITHSGIGINILKNFGLGLDDYGIPEGHPKIEGKKVFIKYRSKNKKD